MGQLHECLQMMDGDEELVIRYVTFDMLISHPRKDKWYLVGCMSLDIGVEAKVREIGPRECGNYQGTKITRKERKPKDWAGSHCWDVEKRRKKHREPKEEQPEVGGQPGDSGVLGPVKEDKALRRREESTVSTPAERPAKLRTEKWLLEELVKRTDSGSLEKKVVMTRISDWFTKNRFCKMKHILLFRKYPWPR